MLAVENVLFATFCMLIYTVGFLWSGESTKRAEKRAPETQERGAFTKPACSGNSGSFKLLKYKRQQYSHSSMISLVVVEWIWNLTQTNSMCALSSNTPFHFLYSTGRNAGAVSSRFVLLSLTLCIVCQKTVFYYDKFHCSAFMSWVPEVHQIVKVWVRSYFLSNIITEVENTLNL